MRLLLLGASIAGPLGFLVVEAALRLAHNLAHFLAPIGGIR